MKVTVTCAGCGKSGRAAADSVPPDTIPICPDCEPNAVEILKHVGLVAPVKVASGDVDEGRDVP